MNDPSKSDKVNEASGKYAITPDQLSKKMHKWAAGGVSGYPLSHPIVGQTIFFEQFKHFIHLVDDESEKFAHVFAIIAQWGIGKSRLAYELMSQINDTSPGWYVRDSVGALSKADLFHDQADRDQYLGLYIRYSQVANESHNIDNWFGFGLYKALLPLTRNTFDNSIQGQIAKEAYDRLLTRGFDETKLAEALEIGKKHSDEVLYDDETLVTRLCQAAYDYLKTLGIKYALIALDELETAAEAATYGLETEAEKQLDGRAIKLIGKAIKEEDPRGKLPFLRYVALCSPAIGHELREIRSTARRFELVELSQNAFADVSDFVKLLKDDQRLTHAYPDGLVEAAYAMSGGNFGWFNVVMANIDQVIDGRRVKDGARKSKEVAESFDVGSLFDEAIRVSSRLRDHVLDKQAVANLEIPKEDLPTARELLYGQLPMKLDRWSVEKRQALQQATNEFGAPISMLFQKVQWSLQGCAKALKKNKFTRKQASNEWNLPGIEEPLDLTQLIANIATYSIHESAHTSGDTQTLLVPLNVSQFVQLAAMLYPHPAVDDAARALWREFIGDDSVPTDCGTHLGPSIDMLNRLNLRLRATGATSFIFRDTDESTAHETALSGLKGIAEPERARIMLTGLMRLLDQHWEYDPIDAGLGGKLVASTTRKPPTGKTALVNCQQLHLHPDGKVIFAWVRSEEELLELCERVSGTRKDQGRVPVLAFTPLNHLCEKFQAAADGKFRAAHEYMMLYEISAREEQQLFPIGLPNAKISGFKFHESRFTSAFTQRINVTTRALLDAIKAWRRKLDGAGRICWPMRNSGILQTADREKLFYAYRELLVSSKQLIDLPAGLQASEIRATLERMAVSTKAKSLDYSDDERCGLFSTLDDKAIAQVPAFLLRIYEQLLSGEKARWSYELAKEEWFWGYTWEGPRPKDTFAHWMVLLVDLGIAEEAEEASSDKSPQYQLIQRSSLKNRIEEANNWLRQEYPQIVERMKTVFGVGRISESFAPTNAAQRGTKTTRAEESLKQSAASLTLIDDKETRWKNLAGDDEKGETFRKVFRARLDSKEKSEAVFNRKLYEKEQDLDSIKQLNLDDEHAPLWSRIRQADLFVNFVLSSKARLEQRADELAIELSVDLEPGFPIQIFTRSLSKIKNILDGSIGEGPAEGDTQKEQFVSPGTLGYALRELKVAQATERLEALAREVGCDLHNDTNLAIEEIDGAIVTGYRNLLKAYSAERNRLSECKDQLAAFQTLLSEVPKDFKYPGSVESFDQLLARPSMIEETLNTTLEEDVDELLTVHQKACRIGNFVPLMEEAKNLLQESKRAIASLASHLATLENAVNAYRQGLLQNEQLQSLEKAYAALQMAMRLPVQPALKLSDLETGYLKDAKDRITTRRQLLVESLDKELSGVSIDHREWVKLVNDLENNQVPSVSQEVANVLVAKGLIRVTYRLGGGA
ncbi:MAG: hypothetical protein Q8M16_18810 [Pirellulaceae bacterium]|nr:hypothetical protein [Pirellulaceae bacterium]